jgi:hypothetical protein
MCRIVALSPEKTPIGSLSIWPRDQGARIVESHYLKEHVYRKKRVENNKQVGLQVAVDRDIGSLITCQAACTAHSGWNPYEPDSSCILNKAGDYHIAKNCCVPFRKKMTQKKRRQFVLFALVAAPFRKMAWIILAMSVPALYTAYVRMVKYRDFTTKDGVP